MWTTVLYSALCVLFVAASSVQQNANTREIIVYSEVAESSPTTCRITNYFKDLSYAANTSLKDFMHILSQRLEDSTNFEPRDQLYTFELLKRQIEEDVRSVRRATISVPFIHSEEMRQMIYVSMTLLEMKKKVSEAVKILSNISDFETSAKDTSIPKLLALYLQIILSAHVPIFCFFSILEANSSNIYDELNKAIYALLNVVSYPSNVRDRQSEIFELTFFLKYLPTAIHALARFQQKIYSLKTVSLGTFYIERISAPILSVLLKLYSLRSITSANVFLDMLNGQFYPSSPKLTLSWTLSSTPIQEFSRCCSKDREYLFKNEKWMIKFLEDSMENMYGAVILRQVQPNHFVKRILKKVKKSNSIKEDSPLMLSINRILDNENASLSLKQKRLVMEKKIRNTTTKIQKVEPPLKTTKTNSNCAKKYKKKGRKHSFESKNSIVSITEAIDALAVSNLDQKNESVSITKAMDTLTVSNLDQKNEHIVANLEAEAVDNNTTNQNDDEPTMFLTQMNSQEAFWGSAPPAVKQAPNMQSDPIIFTYNYPFESINFSTCTVVPQIMLLGGFCQYILDEYAEAMGKSRYTWEDIRNSFGTLQSRKARESLKIHSANVLTECMEVIMLRNQLAHPEIDLTNEEETVRDYLLKALKYDLLSIEHIEALYNMIQKSQEFFEDTPLKSMSFKKAEKKNQGISANEKTKTMLFIGELVTVLFLDPLKDIIIEEEGQDVFQRANTSNGGINETKLKILIDIVRTKRYDPMLKNFGVTNFPLFQKFIDIKRARNIWAHPFNGTKVHLRKAIDSLPSELHFSVANLKVFLENY